MVVVFTGKQRLAKVKKHFIFIFIFKSNNNRYKKII